MILDDDELHTSQPELQATAVFAPVDAGVDPAVDISEPFDPSSHEAWWNMEDGCFVDTDLHPPFLLRQDTLVTTPA